MMKTVKILLVNMLLLLVIGCGNSSDTPNDKNSTKISTTSVENVASIYDYNSDKSAVRDLTHIELNKYQAVQKSLDSLKNNKSAYYATIDTFVLELMRASSSNDKIPSYAPRGENRSHIYSIENNKLNYSTYTLKGDVTDDYAVDFNDINAMKEALFNDNNSAQFDINNDSVLNLEDLIELVARINTHISYFDFYTIEGEKLTLATRSVDDDKILDEASLLEFNLTQIMVVAKDRNHASGFSEGLSDLEDVWYKQKDWIYANTTILEDNPTNATQRSKSKMLQNALDYIVNDVEVDDYLIGWFMSLKFAETGEFKDLLKKEGGTEAGGKDDEVAGQYDYIFENSDFYINPAVAKIRSYFTATNMNNPEKDASTSFGYFYTIGDTRDIDRYVEVVGKDLRQESAYVNGETTVYSNEIFMAGSVLFLSKATHELKGKIDKETPVEGKIFIERTGPGKKEFLQDTPIEGGKFTLKNVPFGAYSVEMEDACKCLSSLDNNFIFHSDEAEASFTPNKNNGDKAKVSLHVIDAQNEVQKNKTVELRATGCLSQTASGNNELYIEPEEKTTNDNGDVTFNDVLIGDYDVYVEGAHIQTVHFCEDMSQVLTLDSIVGKWYGCGGGGCFTLIYSSNHTFIQETTSYGITTMQKGNWKIIDHPNAGADGKIYPGVLHYNVVIPALNFGTSEYPFKILDSSTMTNDVSPEVILKKQSK